MNKSKRRKFSASEKVQIVRRHLLDKVAISELCEEYQIGVSQFYAWQKILFEGAEQVFEKPKKKRASQESKEREQIEKLESKLRRKDEVISELLEEHVQLKKESGVL